MIGSISYGQMADLPKTASGPGFLTICNGGVFCPNWALFGERGCAWR
jgi:hypothetical protein